MGNTVKQPTRTKAYKALIAAGLEPDAALTAYHAHVGTTPEPKAEAEDTRVADLVAAGFTEEQAKAVLTENDTKAPSTKQAQSSQEKGEALVAKKGLSFSKGRVYVTPDIVEASVRVLKTGKPEVVKTSGAGRVHSVLIFRTESGDAAVQNLVKPA